MVEKHTIILEQLSFVQTMYFNAVIKQHSFVSEQQHKQYISEMITRVLWNYLWPREKLQLNSNINTVTFIKMQY